jgi:hypothetical protein
VDSKPCYPDPLPNTRPSCVRQTNKLRSYMEALVKRDKLRACFEEIEDGALTIGDKIGEGEDPIPGRRGAMMPPRCFGKVG